jgi:hypothetical protein
MTPEMTNPYVVDLSFEVDLRIRKIQHAMCLEQQMWRTPTEIITEALYRYAERWGIRDDRDDDAPAAGGDDHEDNDDDDGHRPPDPPPRPRSQPGAMVDWDLALRKLIVTRGEGGR